MYPGWVQNFFKNVLSLTVYLSDNLFVFHLWFYYIISGKKDVLGKKVAAVSMWKDPWRDTMPWHSVSKRPKQSWWRIYFKNWAIHVCTVNVQLLALTPCDSKRRKAHTSISSDTSVLHSTLFSASSILSAGMSV